MSGFGLTALKDVLAGTPGLRSTIVAPTFVTYTLGAFPAFSMSIRLPRDGSVVGAMLVWVKKQGPTHYPFKELTMDQCRLVQDSLSLPLGGPPGATIIFNGEYPPSIQPTDLIEFVCAATDDPDDLETP